MPLSRPHSNTDAGDSVSDAKDTKVDVTGDAKNEPVDTRDKPLGAKDGYEDGCMLVDAEAGRSCLMPTCKGLRLRGGLRW